MDEENESKSFLDISRYSEKTRKIIFGAVVAVILAIVGVAMFVISPQTQQTASTSPEPTATQARVNNDVSPSPSVPATPVPVPTYTAGAYPTDEQAAAAQAQQSLIAKSKAEASSVPTVIKEGDEPAIPDAQALKQLAGQGMLEYCTDNPNETKEEKQARMKPYFHTDNPDYISPQTGIFFQTKCSLGGVDQLQPTSTPGQYQTYVGIAWGGQYKQDSPADTGYTQYTVIVDKDGIVSFND